MSTTANAVITTPEFLAWEELSQLVSVRNKIIFHYIASVGTRDRDIIVSGQIDRIMVDSVVCSHRPPMVVISFVGGLQLMTGRTPKLPIKQISFPPKEITRGEKQWEFVFSNPDFFDGRPFTVIITPTEN